MNTGWAPGCARWDRGRAQQVAIQRVIVVGMASWLCSTGVMGRCCAEARDAWRGKLRGALRDEMRGEIGDEVRDEVREVGRR